MQPTDIEWADFTVNIISGCNGPLVGPDGRRMRCPYCFAHRFSHRLAGRFGYPDDEPFTPTFHADKLGRLAHISSGYKSKFTDMPQGRAIVFVNSMGETFDFENPTEWLDALMGAVKLQQFTTQQHQCVILTKRPDVAARLLDRELFTPLPSNLWLGVSVESDEYYHRVVELAALRTKIPGDYHLVLSVEPLHGPLLPDTNTLAHYEWVIIGAETGNRKGRVEPDAKWVKALVEQCRELKIPVFLKDNLKPYYSDKLIQEFPMSMTWETGGPL